MVEPRVLVIVVNWNGMEYLPKFIETILASTYRNLELIVVDNASTDGSAEIAENHPSVDLVRLPNNSGWATGINAGLASAKAQEADFYLCMNNDVYLEPNTVERLVSFAQDHPGFGVLSPILKYHSSKALFLGGFFTKLGWWKHITLNPDSEEMKRDYTEVDIVIGAAIFVRRDVIGKIGGFDPEFFLYREDVDFCKRAKDAGFRIGTVHGSLAFHVGGGSRKDNGKISPITFDSKGIYGDSVVKYAFKHLGSLELMRWLLTKRGRSSWGMVLRHLPKLASIRRRGGRKINLGGSWVDEKDS